MTRKTRPKRDGPLLAKNVMEEPRQKDIIKPSKQRHHYHPLRYYRQYFLLLYFLFVSCV